MSLQRFILIACGLFILVFGAALGAMTFVKGRGGAPPRHEDKPVTTAQPAKPDPAALDEEDPEHPFIYKVAEATRDGKRSFCAERMSGHDRIVQPFGERRSFGATSVRDWNNSGCEAAISEHAMGMSDMRLTSVLIDRIPHGGLMPHERDYPKWRPEPGQKLLTAHFSQVHFASDAEAKAAQVKSDADMERNFAILAAVDFPLGVGGRLPDGSVHDLVHVRMVQASHWWNLWGLSKTKTLCIASGVGGQAESWNAVVRYDGAQMSASHRPQDWLSACVGQEAAGERLTLTEYYRRMLPLLPLSEDYQLRRTVLQELIDHPAQPPAEYSPSGLAGLSGGPGDSL